MFSISKNTQRALVNQTLNMCFYHKPVTGNGIAVNSYQSSVNSFSEMVTFDHLMVTGNREAVTCYHEMVKGNGQPVTGYRDSVIGNRMPVTGYRTPVTGDGTPVTAKNS